MNSPTTRSNDPAALPPDVNPQLGVSSSPRFQDEKIHSWYTSRMAFPDHLVGSIMRDMSPPEGSIFLDPHCGSGTALVEAQKLGLSVIGIDANPSSVLSSSVKTNWSIDLTEVRDTITSLVQDNPVEHYYLDDPIFSYLEKSGMLKRGWIQADVANEAISIKRWIDRTITKGDLYRFFLLALLNSVIKDAADVKFGPELYCVPPPEQRPNVMACCTARLEKMAYDLEVSQLPNKVGRTCLGDSRDAIALRSIVNCHKAPIYVSYFTPYPTEHDYTRNARLELVFMEAVKNGPSLKRIKRE